MALRWKVWEEVPADIRVKYFDERGTTMADTFSNEINRVAAIYWDRNVPIRMSDGKSRIKYFAPLGIKDRWKRWYPLPKEVASCCKELKLPMGSQYPIWHLQVHCRSIRHVALLYDVDPKELRRIIYDDLGLSPSKRCKCGKFALKDKSFCSHHQAIEDAWGEMEEIADQYESAQLNLLESLQIPPERK